MPTATRCPPPPFSGPSAGADCCCQPGSGQTADRGRGCGRGVPRPTTPAEPGLVDGLLRVRDRPRRICAVIDYATKYCLAATATPTSRGQDALGCLRRAVVEAERVLDLDDLRADRGVMDVVDADDYVIGEAPAPIAVVTDNGPCFRGVTFADAFAGDDPLFRHVRTRVRSPQTNA